MATDGHGHGHGHGGDFVPAGPTHDLGYEPDKFAVKTILVVPVAVLATMFVVFVITTLIFGNIFAPKATVIKPESEAGAAENGAPLNERLSRTSSSDPNARVLQPRLEGMQQKQVYYKDGNPENKDPSNVITSEMIPTQPTAKGNPPRFHADDLRPENVAATAKGSTDPQTGAVRSIPVGQAIGLAGDPKNAEWARALPSREGAPELDLDAQWDRPKESNGGVTRRPAPAPPTPPKKEGGAEPKKGGPTEKEPDKKEPEKGPDPKKQ
jgi:hypothetical protein